MTTARSSRSDVKAPPAMTDAGPVAPYVPVVPELTLFRAASIGVGRFIACRDACALTRFGSRPT